MNKRVEVGQFGAVYGVKGWLKVHSFTDNPESIFDYTPWFLKKTNGEWQEISLQEWKRHNSGFVCKLSNIEQREEAQILTNQSIYVDESTLPELDDGEFYLNDLLDLNVVNLEGYNLGKIVDFMETGANIVLVVKANSNDNYGKKERLIPLVFENTIKNVDLDNQIMEVDWDPDF